MGENLDSNDSSPAVAWSTWRDEIRSIGFTNSLVNFEPNPFAQIDLERGHPGGLAQFVSGGSTLLANLVRDPLAYSRALAAARRIRVKADQLRHNFGINSCFLVGGLASFQQDGFDLTLPILMWPVDLLQHGEDFSIALAGEPIVNPALRGAFDACYDVRIDQTKLLSKLTSSTDLVPISVLDYLSDLGGPEAKLDLKRILVLGNFATEPTLLLKDFDTAKSGLLDSFAAGKPVARAAEVGDVAENELDYKVVVVADADEKQKNIVARSLKGESFAVETLPGCGYLQTVANLLANQALAHKRVLVVAPRRQTLNELSDRLAEIGLPGLLVRTYATWLDLVSGISRNEKAKPSELAAVLGQRDATATKLESYFDSLNLPHEQLGISVAEVVKKLAELAAMPHAPTTTARVSAEHLIETKDASAAIELLNRANDLGEFKFGPQDSAWYQARFESPGEVEQLLSVVNRLRDETYPSLASKLKQFIETVEFRPAVSVSDWGAYLRLFVGIRESLDRFNPSVFDHSLDDLLIATAARKQKNEMSGSTRRRLKKLAKEFLRPGMHVADMNESLQSVKEQRELWNQFSLSMKPPTVPNGINDALVTYQALVADLERIQSHLDPNAKSVGLTRLELNELEAKLDSLCEDTEVLENLGDRSMVANELRAIGLESLMRDLSRMHVSREHIPIEFDLAWHQSALEWLVQKNKELLGFTAENLDTLEKEFNALDESSVSQGQNAVASALSQQWGSNLAKYPGQGEALRTQLKSGEADLASVLAESFQLVGAVSPVAAMSPYEVAANVSPSQKFDLVVIMDAAGTTVAENLAALARSEQVIAFGDDTIGAPAGFEIEPMPTATELDENRKSILSQVAEIWGIETLRHSYRRDGQLLGAFINREFYQNRIVFEPTVDEYFGKNRVSFELVAKDNRAKSQTEGATESLDAEVLRAVDLVFNHALWHPQDSLLVVTASKLHAERIQASLTAGLRDRPDLMEFFDAHGPERFEVTTLSALAHRVADHVIFSLGFGKTQHGAVLSTLGDLSLPTARRTLANLLVSARQTLSIVSCFGAEELTAERVGSGASYLKSLLEASQVNEIESFELDSDPLLNDLSLRLTKLGIAVKTGYGQRLSMVASYSNQAVVLEPDWLLYGETFSEKLRLRQNLLQSLGWKVRRVYTIDLFSDPEGFARSVAVNLGIDVTQKPQVLFEMDEPAFEETDLAWGERPQSNDDRLKAERPPHWG